MTTKLLISSPTTAQLPAIVTQSGPAAPERFLEFFAANIRNPNTRRAYARQVMQFLFWCEGRGVTRPPDVRPLHVADYIETMPALAHRHRLKQRLRRASRARECHRSALPAPAL